MFTKDEIKQALVQLQNNLSLFIPRVQEQMASVEEKDRILLECHCQIKEQEVTDGDQVSESKIPLYSLYISYLQSIRELGFLVSEIHDYNLKLTEVIKAIQNLILRVERYFPNTEQLKNTRMEFAKIALDFENKQAFLGNVVGTLNEGMHYMAQSYVKRPVFQKGIDAEFASLEPSVGIPLMLWCKPWIEKHSNILPPEINPLDCAIATLPSLQEKPLIPSLS
jgi:hypothetical protein